MAKVGFDDGRVGIWGFINRAGEFVIEPIFNQVESFNNGLAEVKIYDNEARQWSMGYIDKTGQYVWEPTS